MIARIDAVTRSGWVVVIAFQQSHRLGQGFMAFADHSPDGGWSVLGHAFFCTRRAARAAAKLLRNDGLRRPVVRRARLVMRVTPPAARRRSGRRR